MIDHLDHAKRRHLVALALGSCLPRLSSAFTADAHPSTTRMLAAWQSDSNHYIGLIDLASSSAMSQARVAHRLPVPTRAHGLLVEAGGSVLAAARRPGDWLVRWHPFSGKTRWQWIEDDARFNGHVMASPDGHTLWTTETDRESGQGCVALRNAINLAKTTTFATQGMDPHEMLVLPRRVGQVPAGTLLVANGGIPTQPETGRAKRDLDRMDASLVALDGGSGRVVGQWRLSDPRLSIRHLAWDPLSSRVGIALQAEHDDVQARQAAPVLAVWDGHSLQTASEQPALAGYGGDICAWPEGGFLVSCTRADQVTLFDSNGAWQRSDSLTEACALTSSSSGWWAAGRTNALQGSGSSLAGSQNLLPAKCRIDNHWATFAPH